MPNLTTVIKNVGYTVLGVITAGWLMNAARDLPFVKSAINGFDA